MYNAKTGRDTEMCAGELSFDQAFERSYSNAMITRLTEDQIRQFMLPAEAVNVTGADERTLLKHIAKRPGALRSLSHILPLASIYADGAALTCEHIHAAMIELGHSPIDEEIGSNKVYADIHQWGGLSGMKPGPAAIPARPYMGLDDVSESSIYDAIGKMLNKAMEP